MSWKDRLFPPRRPEDEPDLSCSFCGLHRREVRKLVAGPKVQICDRCLELCVDILDREARPGGSSFPIDRLLATVAAAGPRAPHAEVRPTLRAVIELARGARGPLVEVARLAFAVEDHGTAATALAAIAAAERTDVDRLDRVAALLELGRTTEAEEALTEVGASEGLTAARVRLYRARAELERGGVPRPQLAVHRMVARELAAALAVLPRGPDEELVRCERYAVLTLAALALGDVGEAEDAARAWLVLAPTAAAHEALAQVQGARGDGDGARATFERARALAHPDGPRARRLTQLGDTPYRQA